MLKPPPHQPMTVEYSHKRNDCLVFMFHLDGRSAYCLFWPPVCLHDGYLRSLVQHMRWRLQPDAVVNKYPRALRQV